MYLKETFLWHILTIIGLNVTGIHLKSAVKCFFVFIRVFFFILAIYVRLWYGIHIRRSVEKFYNISYFVLTCFIIGTFWKKRKQISRTLLHLRKYQTQYQAKDIYLVHFANIISVLMLARPFWMAFAKEIIEKSTDSSQILVQNETCNLILNVILRFGKYIAIDFPNSLPVLLSVALSITFYRWSMVLDIYEHVLRQLRATENNSEFLEDFFSIHKCLRRVSKSLSLISFLIIFHSMTILFVTLHFAITRSTELFSSAFVTVQIFLQFISGALTLTSYTFCAGRIPESLQNIKETARELFVVYGGKNCLPKNVLFYLERMEREDVVYISAYGLFNITKGFILSAVGVTLTYDLLIINFSFN